MESWKPAEVDEEAKRDKTPGSKDAGRQMRVPIRTVDLGLPLLDLTNRKSWIPAIEPDTD